MLLAVEKQGGQKHYLAGLPCGKAKRAMLGFVAAAALTMLAAIPAWALDGPIQDSDSGSGTTADPYVISVSSGDYTRPSAFWSGTGVNAVSGGEGVGSFAVVFDSGPSDYNSTMFFDMSVSGGLNSGKALFGPLYIGSGASGVPGSYIGDPTDDFDLAAIVWDGNWTYAFRLCPYVTFQNTDGDAAMERLAFNWKGCFATYFDDWAYRFNAAGALGAAEGQTVTLTYYGGYLADQTSRGTNYTPNFNTIATDLTYGSGMYSTSDSPADIDGYSASAVVGADGYVTFAGSQAIKYGGNYDISVA